MSSAFHSPGAPRSPNPRSCMEFTLIELLVVISIIAILAAMLLPALGKARKVAMRATCAGTVKQLILGTQMYADDSGGFIPSPTDWISDPNTVNITRDVNVNGTTKWYAITVGSVYAMGYLNDWQILYCPSATAWRGAVSKQFATTPRDLWLTGAGPQYLRSNYAYRLQKTTKMDGAGFGARWEAWADRAIISDLTNYPESNYGPGGILAPYLHAQGSSKDPMIGERDGMNTAFHDGHVRWLDYSKLLTAIGVKFGGYTVSLKNDYMSQRLWLWVDKQP